MSAIVYLSTGDQVEFGTRNSTNITGYGTYITVKQLPTSKVVNPDSIPVSDLNYARLRALWTLDADGNQPGQVIQTIFDANTGSGSSDVSVASTSLSRLDLSVTTSTDIS